MTLLRGSAALCCLATVAECFTGPLGALPGRPAALRGAAVARRPQLAGVRAQQDSKGTEDKGKSMVDKIAGKGIWQFGVSKEAGDALASVGWADASEEEGVTERLSIDSVQRSDVEALVQRAVDAETFADDRSKQMFIADTREQLVRELVRREVRADLGCELEDLLNPIKVVSLETKILAAEQEIAQGADAERSQRLLDDIDKYRADLAVEKRAIMKDWLKMLFRGQAVLSLLVGGYMANNPEVSVAFRALGFWTIWLFTIPSLRAVKPLGYPSLNISANMEKKALNLAFVLTPLLTLLLPVFTKDTAVIFWADVATVAACYALYVAKGDDPDGGDGVEIKGVLRYLDYGTGRERGARKK
mmetsp:Transcript_37665/g.92574  ORF Transcript_37665/g.92574 Transcript_37665/m.92574 type:complete len:360 (-) Transcript_37665:183-1262(-)